jgi:hypothetical protein
MQFVKPAAVLPNSISRGSQLDKAEVVYVGSGAKLTNTFTVLVSLGEHPSEVIIVYVVVMIGDTVTTVPVKDPGCTVTV